MAAPWKLSDTIDYREDALMIIMIITTGTQQMIHLIAAAAADVLVWSSTLTQRNWKYKMQCCRMK